jgi:molecular chaperone DnaK (HSP70)
VLFTLEDNSPAIGSDGRLVQTVGLEGINATFSTTLAAGCALPCWNAEVLSTGHNNASTIDVALFRGTSSTDSHKIGEIEISGIAPAPRGIPQVVLGFGAVDRRLVLHAMVRETRKPLAISRKGD